jgi:hypothetical protein
VACLPHALSPHQSLHVSGLQTPLSVAEGSGGSAVAHMGGSGCGCLRSSCSSTSCSTAQEDDRGHTITHMRALAARWRAADTSPSTSNHVIPRHARTHHSRHSSPLSPFRTRQNTMLPRGAATILAIAASVVAQDSTPCSSYDVNTGKGVWRPHHLACRVGADETCAYIVCSPAHCV